MENENILDNSMMRFGNISEMDKSFDIKFWQKQSSTERLAAVLEMVKSYHLRKGNKDGIRLQRTVEHFQRKSS